MKNKNLNENNECIERFLLSMQSLLLHQRRHQQHKLLESELLVNQIRLDCINGMLDYLKIVNSGGRAS